MLVVGDGSDDSIRSLIEPIGFACEQTEDSLTVTTPTWRPDCALEVDIIEEVARHYGYERLGKTVPKSTLPGGLTPLQHRGRRLREVLLGLGISEAMPHPFLAANDLAKAGLPAEAVRLQIRWRRATMLRTSAARNIAGVASTSRIANSVSRCSRSVTSIRRAPMFCRRSSRRWRLCLPARKRPMQSPWHSQLKQVGYA